MSRVAALAAAVIVAALTACGAADTTAGVPGGSSTAAPGGAGPAGPSLPADAGAAGPGGSFSGNPSCPADGQQPYAPNPPATNGGSLVGQAIGEMPHSHVPLGQRVAYTHNPPTSGCHWSAAGAPASPGVATSPVPPEAFVHNLEHGYVVVLYNCPQGCTDAVAALQAWYATLPPDAAAQGAVPYAKVVITADTAMPVAFAAVAWDYYLAIPTFDLALVKAFYANHIGHSPESPLSG